MSRARYLGGPVREDLGAKMVFLAGPRQVGKTTLARQVLEGWEGGAYLSSGQPPVRLPGDRVIIVDAKVPDLDFLNALEAADATKRAESLAAHAAKLKATIKALADRDYPRQFPNALDYVVLFLPAESLFSAALEGDHDLIVWAAAKADSAGDAGVADRAAALGERELAAARADGKRAEDCRSGAGTLLARGHVHGAFRENPRRTGEGQRGVQQGGRQLSNRAVRPAGEKI